MVPPVLRLVLQDAGDDDVTEAVYSDTTVPVIVERRRAKNKRRLWTQVLLFIGMIFGLTLCATGFVYLYGGRDLDGVSI